MRLDWPLATAKKDTDLLFIRAYILGRADSHRRLPGNCVLCLKSYGSAPKLPYP